MRILCFADAHIEPEDGDYERFAKLGNFIVKEKPDTVIDLGDTFSLSAISGWDMSKRLTMEGRRYNIDVESAAIAVDTLFSPLETLWEQARRNKSKQYRPTWYRIKGNHEYREERYLEQNPELAGMLDIDRLSGYSSRYDVCVPYRGCLCVAGINFVHCPVGGNDMPLSGINVAHKALSRFRGHVVSGHYHRTEIACGKFTDAKSIHKAVLCPAFFEGQPTYLSPSAPAVVDAGVLLIDVGDSGVPYVQEISLQYLKDNY